MIRRNYANAVSTLALVVALTIGGAYASGQLISSKQIRNGSVKSVDLKNGGVQGVDVNDGSIKAPDIAEDAVDSPEIAPGAVEGPELNLPPPTQCDIIGTTAINPTMAFQKIADVCVATKVAPDSALEVTWSGPVEGHNGGQISGCVFELRVNDAQSAQGGGDVFEAGLGSVSTSAIFTGLPVAPVTVSIWARLAAQEPGMGGQYDACTLGPATAGGAPQTVIIQEQVI